MLRDDGMADRQAESYAALRAPLFREKVGIEDPVEFCFADADAHAGCGQPNVGPRLQDGDLPINFWGLQYGS